MRRFANELVDQILPLGRGDFHELFAMPLPMRVMALVVGIPQDNLAQYKVWSDIFMNKAFNAPREIEAAIKTLYAFFDTQFEARRRQLRDAGITEPGPEHAGSVLSNDLISQLMVSRFQGRYLTDQELRRVTRGFFIGGNETTTSLILNILVRMSEKRERWERIRANPELIPNVVEESLRCDPPTLGMFRGTTCPVQIDGVTIPENARVMFSIPSANRDPAIFPNATEFDIDRPIQQARKHVAFSYGTHFCPGGWLSRLETKIALEVLVERMPELRVTGPGSRIEPFNFWGRKTLPVAWD
jgi:cytochrome P450